MGPNPLFEVDTSVVDDVVQTLGAEQLGTFIASIGADIGHLIAQLSGGGSPEAFADVGRAAHHLAGGCRSLGFVSIGNVCTRLEADARERVFQHWAEYAVELAQQQQALNEWWSIASTDPRFTGPLE